MRTSKRRRVKAYRGLLFFYHLQGKLAESSLHICGNLLFGKASALSFLPNKMRRADGMFDTELNFFRPDLNKPNRIGKVVSVIALLFRAQELRAFPRDKAAVVTLNTNFNKGGVSSMRRALSMSKINN
jgi:hypothetical protein